MTFYPRAKQTQTASLSVSDNAAGSPQTVSLSGIGTIAQMLPVSLSFASQSVGTSSAPQTVTLSNVSSSTVINITSIAVTGSNKKDFTQTNNCGSSLAAGASCTINATFSPVETGSLAATLTVSDDGGGTARR